MPLSINFRLFLLTSYCGTLSSLNLTHFPTAFTSKPPNVVISQMLG